MIKLNKTEKEEIIELSNEFVSIHQEIMNIEDEIQKSREKADQLIRILEQCREKEKDFTKKMYSKYGEGRLDPINLKWIKNLKK